MNLRRVLNRKRVHKELQLIAIDVIRELHMICATSPTSKQFALTSARIASASDNVVAPLSEDELAEEGVAHFPSHVDAICVHAGLAQAEGADQAIRQQHVHWACASVLFHGT